VDGVLRLPYAELAEPFTAWYDGKTGKSRVDMYGGMTKTVQRQDQGAFGSHYLVAPMSNEDVMNKQTCFIVKGSEDSPVKIQSLLPDLTNFTFSGMEEWKEMKVMVWKSEVKIFSRVSKYVLYMHPTSYTPLLYKMNGYNSLTGSHFDEYVVEYGIMSTNITQQVFDVFQDMKCHGFPGPGHAARAIVNPMKEFIHPVDDSHVHLMHDDFKETYNKTYRSQEEYTAKKDIFKHNLRYIHSMNRRQLSYKLAVNHLAEHTPGELRHMRGRRTTPRAQRDNTGLINVTSSNNANVPEEMNWRLRGAVTPVKDQATCGSCWSFGATGNIEGALFLKTGELVRLSQQNLMDCSWGFGNNGCDGGEEFRSFQYMMKHGGLATEEEYGHYLGADGFCRPKVSKAAKITGYVNVASGDVDALKEAIATHGPVSVGIDASHLSLSFYSHGVYYEEKCGSGEDDLDHAVLAVGYGTLNNEPYWLVKNSWSTHWGNDGYVLMSRKNNNCGVATDAAYVLM